MKLDEALNLTRIIKNQSKQLADILAALDHPEFNVKTYLVRIKKLSFQSLDILNEIERQTGFLKNEIKNYEQRKQAEENRKKSAEEAEQRRKRKNHEL
jgi:ArsR family metal-binding transcriptional regulator